MPQDDGLRSEDVVALLGSLGVTFFTGVPDSLLKSFCAFLDEKLAPSQHIIAANEGTAVALAAGHHLATNTLPVVYMQNSGLGNAVNPLVSLADKEVYGIPMLLIIGWRGEPGTPDEPQHRKMGSVTQSSLDALDLDYYILPQSWEEASKIIQSAAKVATEENKPVALLVKKGVFAPHKGSEIPTSDYTTTREEAIACILEHGGFPKNTTFIATTGMPSRELFELREKRGEGHELDFLTVGSMGHASQIALAIALAQPERQVVCLDGDGAAIMHLGGLATIGSRSPTNFTHIILNNGAHDSVGGQPTAGFDIDFCAVAKGCGYVVASTVTDKEHLTNVLQGNASTPGPRLIEVRICKGARSDLGRPTTSPEEAKSAFMKALSE